tara:strand:- start:7950 stop:8105 length:156 start_codon:yes stop_codon:yes gene_type:complete
MYIGAYGWALKEEARMLLKDQGGSHETDFILDSYNYDSQWLQSVGFVNCGL